MITNVNAFDIYRSTKDLCFIIMLVVLCE